MLDPQNGDTTTVANDHPSQDILLLWIAGRLAEHESAAIESHVEGCLAICQPILDSLNGFEDSTVGWPMLLDQKPAQPAAPIPPPVLPGFEMLELLGEGGMGQVYKAHHLPLRRMVAVKFINSGGSRHDKLFRARFRIEAEAMATLQHPNIVTIHAFDESAQRPYLVMEYADGGSLSDRLKEQAKEEDVGPSPLSPRQAARLVEILARATHYAHERGVIHRDLKPQNILLASAAVDVSHAAGSMQLWDRVWIPKVTDFGLAKFAAGAAEQSMATYTGNLIGSPAYMAPEQAQGDHRSIGVQTDVHALGAILYHVLTGRAPYQAATIGESISLVTDDALPAGPRQCATAIPADLDTVCMKCLQKSPTDRYPTALALADDLRRFLALEPIEARPFGAIERGWRWMRRNPALAIAIFAVLASMMIGTAISLTYAAHSRQSESIARAAEAKAESNNRELQQQLYVTHIAVAERELGSNEDFDRAGEMLAECPPALRGWEWRYLARRLDGQLPPLSGHRKGVWMAAFSPDGSTIATASIDGTLKLWNAASGTLLRTIDAQPISIAPFIRSRFSIPDIPIMCVAYSPDGSTLATGSFAPKFDLSPAKIFSGLPEAIVDAANSRGVVTLWDARTGRQIERFSDPVGIVLSVAFSPDGKYLAFSTINPKNVFVIFDIVAHKCVKTMTGHEGAVHRLRFSSDGRWLASGDSTGVVRLWDAQTLELAGSPIDAHPAPVIDVAFSPDCRSIATAGEDGKICLWDVSTHRKLKTLEGHMGAALGVAFSPDGKLIASAGFDRTVRLWDAATGEQRITLRGHQDAVWSVEFSPDGQRLVSASFDKTARIWDATPIEPPLGPMSFTPGHHERVNCVAYSPDGLYLATSSWDRDVRLWNARSGALVRVFSGHSASVWQIAFSPDGTQMASASWDHTVRIWKVADGKTVRILPDFTQPVQCVAYSRDGKHLAAGGFDGHLRVWTTADWRLSSDCHDFLLPVLAVAFSPDGQRIASGGNDPAIKLWDIAGNELMELPGNTATVYSLQFSHDGRKLISGGWDNSIRIWNVSDSPAAASPASDRLLKVLWGHESRVNGVAFSPDDSLIASASEDKTVRLWSTSTFEQCQPPRFERGPVWSIAFSPDGHHLATAYWSKSGGIKTWTLPALKTRDH